MNIDTAANSRPFVAITGSTGLIGAKLADVLAKLGFTILRPRRENLLSDLEKMKPTHIINCIGAGMDVRKNQSGIEIWEANFELPVQLLQFAMTQGSKFINIGSILESVRAFSSPYIESKRNLTLEISRLNGKDLHAVSILTPIVFGLEREHVFISEILKSASTKSPVQLESPAAIREFLHIDDLADIIANLLNAKAFELSNFELGTGTGYRLSSLCDSVLHGLLAPTWTFTPQAGRTNEYAVVADVDYARNQLDFRIHFEIEQWLRVQFSNSELERK